MPKVLVRPGALRASYLSAATWTLGELGPMLLFVLPVIMFWDALLMMLIGMALYKMRILDGSRTDSFYLRLMLAGFAVDTLSLSVSAQPPFDPPRQPVGYTAVGPGDSEGLAIPLAQVPRFLAAHRTLLLRIRLTRLVDSGAFVFRNP